MPRPAPLPLLLAILMTALNAGKPAVVDDPAYLRMARHLAAHTGDPYGFEQFWYAAPEPAMGVLAPPVVPYALAVGFRLFGDHLFLVKLALFPFAWILTAAGFALFRRFARGTEQAGALMLALSAAVLPLFNCMLDVPALGLSLAAVAVFARACDKRSTGWAVGAGALAALAVQAKYSALPVPAVLALYGLLHRRLGLAAVAVAAMLVVAGGWEAWVWRLYGESHFVRHAQDQGAGRPVWETIEGKLDLARPLLTYGGVLAAGWGLFAGRAAGFPRWAVAAAAGGLAVGLLLVILAPQTLAQGPRVPSGYPRFGLALTVGKLAGAGLAVTVGLCLAKLLVRHLGRTPRVRVTGQDVVLEDRRGASGLRRHPAAWFLAGWLLIELAGYFALTPFPAGRRVVGVAAVVGLVACRAVSRLGRVDPSRRPARWAVAYSCGLGLLFAGLDAWDALAEKVACDRAAEVVAGRGGVVWTQGHWGWQFYAERHGFRQVVIGRDVLAPGDWLVRPVHPAPPGFYRPHFGDAAADFDPAGLELVEVIVRDDRLPYQTVPTLYGGDMAVMGRDFPRLQVHVYRVTAVVTPTAQRR